MNVLFRRVLRQAAVLGLMCSALVATPALSVTLNQQQIDAFKKLSPAQQKALARQYGFDPAMLGGGNQSNNPSNAMEQSVVMPRAEEEQTESFDFDQKFAPKTKALERYGLELFAGEPTTFEPLNNVPVPTDYVIGPGDNLNIMLYGKVSGEYEVAVNREGMVVIPELNPISVTGLRFDEARKTIIEQVRSKMIGVEASVSMGKLRSIRIFVLGESYKPGAYAISSLSTITHALIASGGISDIGSLRNIQLKRSGKVVANLDLYDLLIRGDNSGDVPLRANDVVFIPAVGDLVSVTGQVRREAIFEMKADESFADLLKMAGGLPSTAYPEGALIERFSGGSLRTLINVNLAEKNKLLESPVNGDKLHVPGVSEQYKDAISLIGAVVRPGKLQWRKGLHIGDILKSVHGDLLAVADLEYGLVVRERNSQGNIDIIQFNPIRAIERSNPGDNLELNPRDKVVIFSRFETIEAENRLLDKFAYTENEINDRQQEQLWDRYQQQKFLDYVGAESEDSESDDELNRRQFEMANKSLTDLTSEDDLKRKTEQDYSLFSRRRLLAPILLQLKEQASPQNPVQLVEIDGKVKYPGVYPLPMNGQVTDLLDAAGGVLESAYLDMAELTRIVNSGSGTRIEHVSSNIGRAIMEPKSSDNLMLTSKDRLNVLAIPNWQENITVRLAGEFKFPGVYTIERGEKLSSVIARAGGFTSFSAPSAAVFSRASLRQKERQHLNKLSEDLKRNIAAKSFQVNMADTSVVSYSETKQLLEDLSNVRAVGRLVVDLGKVLDKTSDIQLEDGDALYVPPVIQSVNVIGEVNVATAHMFNKQLSVKEYIERSGGFKQRADEDRIYIIKADGSVVIPNSNEWFAVNYDVNLAPGDTIVVPLDAEHMDNLTLWSSATQILYQIGVAVAAIGAL